jgi:tetratricopeptide (TPR) repeat protein
MSDNAKRKIRFLIGTELAVILCIVCIWLVRTATIGTNITKATVLTQGENSTSNAANAMISLSNVFNKPQNIQQQIQQYKEAIRENPNDFDAYFNLGGCYSKLGNEKEAMLATKEALRIRPDYAFAQIALGLNYHNLGQYDQAIETYKQAVKLDPQLAEQAKLLISNSYAASGQPEKAGSESI